jgi:hypothetical protein
LSLDRDIETGAIVVVVSHTPPIDAPTIRDICGGEQIRLAGISDADLLGFAAEITAACQQNLVNTQRGLPVADTEPPPKVVKRCGCWECINDNPDACREF